MDNNSENKSFQEEKKELIFDLLREVHNVISSVRTTKNSDAIYECLDTIHRAMSLNDVKGDFSDFVLSKVKEFGFIDKEDEKNLKNN